MTTMALREEDVQSLKAMYFSAHPDFWQEDTFFTVVKQLPPFYMDDTATQYVYPYMINDLTQLVEKCNTFIKDIMPRIEITTDVNVLQSICLILKHSYQIACLLACYDKGTFVISRNLIHARQIHTICNAMCDRMNHLNRVVIFNEFDKDFIE